jgi:hypothetical protein
VLAVAGVMLYLERGGSDEEFESESEDEPVEVVVD